MKLEVYKKKISKTYTQFNDINKNVDIFEYVPLLE